LARRDAKAQEAHDKGVLAEALELRRAGWNVLADLSGWSRPPLIAGKHRPDVYATKRGHTRIVEIETDEWDDHDQHSTFRHHAGQKENTIFYGWIVNAAGRRVKKFY